MLLEISFFLIFTTRNLIMNQINNEKQFRKALGMYSTGIAVVTAIDNNKIPIGMTVNSFTSVSLDPALILWSIDKKQPSYKFFFKF